MFDDIEKQLADAVEQEHVQRLIRDGKWTVCLELDGQAIPLSHLGGEPADGVRQALVMQDRWAEVDAEVPCDLEDLSQLRFDIGHFPFYGLILLGEVAVQERQL